MSRFALIEGGIVANVVEQDSPPTIPGEWVECGAAGPGDLYDGNNFTRPPAPVIARHITAYAFKMRLTAAERIGIRAAAASNAAVYDWLDLADSARYIDLDLLTTREGVLALEAAGLLAVGRAAEVLDAPVQDAELP